MIYPTRPLPGISLLPSLYPRSMMEDGSGPPGACRQKQLFAVMTGDCGTGKTTIVRKLKDTLEPSEFMLLYLADSKLTPEALLQRPVRAAGLRGQVLPR